MNLRRVLLIIAGIFALIFIGAYYYFTKDLPPLKDLADYRPNLVTKVLSDDGQVIGEFYIERRVVVPLERLPDHLIKAFLAAEDAEFYEHEGISYIGIFRAFMKNLKAGKVVQGGSTITQQLAKSFLRTSERKYSRKIREAILATRIERELDKGEILEMYLNQIYFGNGAYGIQTASESYFGKDVEDLSVAESALLAGLPKAPSRYSPYNNMKLAKERQLYILDRMLEENFITLEGRERARNFELKLRPRKSRSLWIAPYFTENVRKYIEQKYGRETLYRGGLKVYTTLNVEYQRAANEAVRNGLRAHDKRRGYRGPVTQLTSREAIDEFKAQTERELGGGPLNVGGVYRGVITDVNTRRLSVAVDVGDRSGVIRKKDLAWAKLYNPTMDSDGGKYAKFAEIFHVGDVVDVRVKSIPVKAGAPFPLELAQEPLAQGSLLAIEPETGYIRAMVGGYDFKKSEFNRATQSIRQPGSAFKPIIYTTAMDYGYTPARIVIDSPLVFEEEKVVDETAALGTVDGESADGESVDGQVAPDGGAAAEGEEAAGGQVEEQQEWKLKWRPRNYDEQFYGPMTVREALAKSRNVVTIKVLRDIGVRRAIEYARKMGITSPLAGDLSLALGSSAVSLKEMTTAFATLANMGRRAEPIYITRVLDKDGYLLEENSPVIRDAISPQTAYVMTSLLESVIESGTGWRARVLKRPAAGKTGTTNNLNDAWFIGYVPGLATGVWVGYDEEKPLGRYETGSRAALPIWTKFMMDATTGTRARDFPVPEGIEFAKIDPKTGLLATPRTKNPVFEVFKAGTVPTRTADTMEKPLSSDFFMMDTGPGSEEIADEPRPEPAPHGAPGGTGGTGGTAGAEAAGGGHATGTIEVVEEPEGAVPGGAVKPPPSELPVVELPAPGVGAGSATDAPRVPLRRFTE
ncbi:MAG: penicillin-binding protein 1A [Thermodesulfobacteriota bacterium]